MLISYLLLAPIILEIDSDAGICRVRFHKIVSANLKIDEESIFLKLKLAGWRKKYNLLDFITKPKEKKSVIKRSKKERDNLSFKKMFRILKSFRVRRFFISVDTDNMQMDGFLYPVFLLIQNLTGKKIQINFIGENTVKLTIENNIARVMWAFIKK